MPLEFTAPAGLTRAGDFLTDEGLAFGQALHQNFADRREEWLGRRVTARQKAVSTAALDFAPETRTIKETVGKVTPALAALQHHWMETTSPATMAINALDSGAKVWPTDLADASSEDHVDFLTLAAYDLLEGVK